MEKARVGRNSQKDYWDLKILAIDFSIGTESLSIASNRYGGAGVIYSWLRELLPNFYTVGIEESYTDILPTEKKDKCLVLSKEHLQRIKDGGELDSTDFDLIFHCSTETYVNTSLKQVLWVPGQGETVHPKHTDILLHSPEWQFPQCKNSCRSYSVQIGKPVPKYEKYQKKNYIFQCTNHHPCFRSHVIAEWCNKNGIECHFGGPIDSSYNLLKYIDNKHTFYHGVMSYKDKIEMTKYARCHTLYHSNAINFTLSGFEALAYSVPLIVSVNGFWPEFIRKWGVGFCVQNEKEFLTAYEDCPKIDEMKLRACAENYSAENMVNSFYKAFETILSEKRQTN